MTQTHTMDQERPITLREQELLDRGKHLAEQLAVRDQLVAAKKADAKRRQDEIDELDEEISDIAAQLRSGFENRKQGDLFIDQALPKDEAARRLAEVAKRADRHPFVADSERIDTCAREACGKPAQDETHQPPTPSEPHTFVPDGKGEGKCWACESDRDDPVHAEPTLPAPEEPPMLAECSRCGKRVPKAEVRYDAGVKPVCETCVRAGIEAGTWPHPFRKATEKATHCADCHQREDDGVHVEPLPPVEVVGNADPNAPHVARPDEDGIACLFCTRAVDDPLHYAAASTVLEDLAKRGLAHEGGEERGGVDEFDPALDEPAEGGGAGA